MSATVVTPVRKASLALRIALILTVVACAAWLGISRQFYADAIVDAFFALALASVIIIHLRVRPSWTDGALIVAGMCILGASHVAVAHEAPRIMAWFSFAGLTSFTILSIRSIWDFEQRSLLYAWVPAALFVASDYFASTMLAWTSRVQPRTLDLYLLSFDGSLGRLISFDVGRVYASVTWFHVCALIAYIGLALPIAMVYAGRLVRFRQGALPVMLAFVITGPVGIVLYNLFPACGPHDLLGAAFPFHPIADSDLQRLLLDPVAIQGPRNAMPSLHMSWTLLAWWYSRGLSWTERIVAFAFLAWTVVATLGTGEHYVADLIVAFPFSLMIQTLCLRDVRWRDSSRWIAFVAGASATVAWLIALRYAVQVFWYSPLIPWMLSAVTVAFVCWRQNLLARAGDVTARAPAVTEFGRSPAHAVR